MVTCIQGHSTIA